MAEADAYGSLIRSGLFSKQGLRFFHRLAWVALGTAALALFLYLILWGIVRHKERQAEEAWSALDKRIIAPEQRFNTPLTSPAATALDRILDSVGLSPKRDLSHGLFEPTPWEAVQGPIHQYLETQLERPDPPFSPVEGDLARFMGQWGGTLDQARIQLLSDPPPRWSLEAPGSKRGTHINFYMINGLGEWLLADALQAQLRWDHGRVAEDLEATWVLVELLLEWPHTHAQSVSVALARAEAGVLRKVDAGIEPWDSRLRAVRFRTGLESALALHGHGYLNAFRYTAKLPFFGRRARKERMLWKIYGRLWYRYSMADASFKTARELDAFLALGECGRGAIQAGKKAVQEDSKLWGAIGKAGLPSFGLDWNGILRLRLDFEFTRKILRLKAARGEDGRWPNRVNGIEESDCPDCRWAYSLSPEGAARLLLEKGTVFPSRKGGIDLPVLFESPGPLHPVIEISGSS